MRPRRALPTWSSGRFVADRPNQLWVCDLTYLKTREGFLYLAFVKDVFSRMIVGWQTATHLRTDLVLDALEMAVHLRQPAAGELVHHTDRGSQYTSFRYTQRLADLGIAASVGSVADAYDNAMAESFVGTLKTELIAGRIFGTRFDAEIAVVEYLGWFNHTRLHAALGDLPPAERSPLRDMRYGWGLLDRRARSEIASSRRPETPAEEDGMARGISLHIGVNRVDPAHYDGWDGALNACEFDANDMESIARAGGFETSKLLSAEATAATVTAQLERAAHELTAGDLFWLTYSGHGGQVADRNGDELDRSDETWVLYDRQLVDDELYGLYDRFADGVRILVLSDSCHSGSVTRAIDGDVPDPVATRERAASQSPAYRAMPRDVLIATYREHQKVYDEIQQQLPNSSKVDPDATVLLISGCQDDQLSLDGMANGLFTETLRSVWNEGGWSGGHAVFHEAIRAQMPPEQQPQYSRVGADNPAFEEQTPFSIG